MITHTPLSYIGLRLSIFALRLVTPLSIFYLSYSIADHPSSLPGKLLLAWCALEAAFWALIYIPRSRALQASATHPAPLAPDERKALFWKCWDKIPNPEWYVNKWFLGARPQDVKRENVKSFFRWALLNKGDAGEEGKGEIKDDEVEMVGREEEELEGYVDGVQTLLGRRIEEGKGSAECLRLTVDKVKMLHRPVVWYMIVGLVDSLTALYLRYHAFHLHRTSLLSTLTIFPFRLANLFTRTTSPAPEISYWYRPHTSKTRLPVLFIHGISMGLYSYAQFLADINASDPLSPSDGEIGILALEIMPISFRISKPVLGKDEMCAQIRAILDFHGFEKVVLASHSYGSVITTHILQDPDLAPRIANMLLVDPVTFLLHLPDVAYNFTARRPRKANEWQLYYFASTDMMVAQTLGRHFFWAQNILWKEDLQRGVVPGGRKRDVTVSLGGRDLIVDTETVGRYLNGVGLGEEGEAWKESGWGVEGRGERRRGDVGGGGGGLKTVWWPDCDHAQVFEWREGRRVLGDVVRGFVEVGVDEEEEEV